MIETKNLTKLYGSFAAVKNFSEKFKKGRITGIIGPNGAGKTTLLNLLSGEIQPSAGEIIFKNENITDSKNFEVARKGISRCFQTTQVFSALSPSENLEVAARGVSDPLGEKSRENLLSEIGISEKEKIVEKMSVEKKKKLELCMAFTQNPDLLLADEITAGLEKEEEDDVVNFVKNFSANITMIIVEHRLRTVFELADWVVVLYKGNKLAEGTIKEIKKNKKVRDVYLGEE